MRSSDRNLVYRKGLQQVFCVVARDRIVLSSSDRNLVYRSDLLHLLKSFANSLFAKWLPSSLMIVLGAPYLLKIFL